MTRVLQGRPVVPGSASGAALVSSEPISLWGGLNPRTGEVSDRRHERSGECVAGRVFVFPHGRGSSTGSAILMESINAGVAPAAIINSQTDAIAALGSIVADEMYGKSVPIVVLAEDDFRSIREGDWLTVLRDGTVTVGDAEKG